VFEYALAAPLPSGRETFHAKLVLADDTRAYIGSSNLQASALERSLELGVIVSGDTCRHLHRVLSAVMAVARPVQL
jgi:phosphatidylserine/phosphatidylglycerophosphate/cardiolipin synthase-like enzyme